MTKLQISPSTSDELVHLAEQFGGFLQHVARVTQQALTYLKENPQVLESLRYWMEDAPADLKAAFGDAGYLIPEDMSMEDVNIVRRAYRTGGTSAAKAAIQNFYDELFNECRRRC